MMFIGIDISKQSFDVAALLDDGKYVHQKFDNHLNGFKNLFKWQKGLSKEAVFCLEATGIYGLALAKFIYQQSQKVIVANPIKTHAFVKMEMSRVKTDKADAMSIARYCKHLYDNDKLETSLFVPKSLAYERMQHLITRLEQLTKLKGQESNRLDVSLDKDASTSIKQMVRYLNQQIIQIKQKIKSVVANDKGLNAQVKLLVSIKGIGEKTAWTILGYLGDVALFNNAKQVSSYAGLDPKIKQSGICINQSSLSKMGHKRLRKSLYMPAIVAVKHNPLMTDLYTRLKKKGKPGKVPLCAVMRKLLVLSYGVLKSGKPFDPNYAK